MEKIMDKVISGGYSKAYLHSGKRYNLFLNAKFNQIIDLPEKKSKS
jgi:hypothetical protein